MRRGGAAPLARTLLYALVVWAPLPLGGNRPVFWAINGAAATLVLVLFLIGESGRNRRLDIDWRIPATATGLFVIVLLFMVVQALPGAGPSVRHPVWLALAGSQDDRYAAISINPGATLTTLAELAPIGLLAIVAFCLGLDARRSTRLLQIVVAITTAIAAYGMVAEHFGLRQVFLLDEDAYPGFLTGTFVNRNTAATYLVLGIAAATSLIAAKFENPGRARSRFVAFAELGPGTGVLLGADIVLVAGLLDTGSRGGFIAAACALLAVLVIALRRTRTMGRAGAIATVAVLAILLVAVGASNPQLLGRIQAELGPEDRLNVYRDTLDMIWARPWLGQGGGAFVDAFPLFHRRAANAELWTHGHSTYLQAAAELGLPMFAVLMSAVLLVALTLVRNVGLEGERQPATTAAIAVLAAVGFHSLVDFSLQIEAVGLTVAVLVGAGLGETLGCRARRRQREADNFSESGNFAARRETIYVTIDPRPVAPAAGSARTH